MADVAGITSPTALSDGSWRGSEEERLFLLGLTSPQSTQHASWPASPPGDVQSPALRRVGLLSPPPRHAAPAAAPPEPRPAPAAAPPEPAARRPGPELAPSDAAGSPRRRSPTAAAVEEMSPRRRTVLSPPAPLARGAPTRRHPAAPPSCVVHVAPMPCLPGSPRAHVMRWLSQTLSRHGEVKAVSVDTAQGWARAVFSDAAAAESAVAASLDGALRSYAGGDLFVRYLSEIKDTTAGWHEEVPADLVPPSLAYPTAAAALALAEPQDVSGCAAEASTVPEGPTGGGARAEAAGGYDTIPVPTVTVTLMERQAQKKAMGKLAESAVACSDRPLGRVGAGLDLLLLCPRGGEWRGHPHIRLLKMLQVGIVRRVPAGTLNDPSWVLPPWCQASVDELPPLPADAASLRHWRDAQWDPGRVWDQPEHALLVLRSGTDGLRGPPAVPPAEELQAMDEAGLRRLCQAAGCGGDTAEEMRAALEAARAPEPAKPRRQQPAAQSAAAPAPPPPELMSLIASRVAEQAAYRAGPREVDFSTPGGVPAPSSPKPPKRMYHRQRLRRRPPPTEVDVAVFRRAAFQGTHDSTAGRSPRRSKDAFDAACMRAATPLLRPDVAVDRTASQRDWQRTGHFTPPDTVPRRRGTTPDGSPTAATLRAEIRPASPTSSPSGAGRPAAEQRPALADSEFLSFASRGLLDITGGSYGGRRVVLHEGQRIRLTRTVHSGGARFPKGTGGVVLRIPGRGPAAVADVELEAVSGAGRMVVGALSGDLEPVDGGSAPVAEAGGWGVTETAFEDEVRRQEIALRQRAAMLEAPAAEPTPAPPPLLPTAAPPPSVDVRPLRPPQPQPTLPDPEEAAISSMQELQMMTKVLLEGRIRRQLAAEEMDTVSAKLRTRRSPSPVRVGGAGELAATMDERMPTPPPDLEAVADVQRRLQRDQYSEWYLSQKLQLSAAAPQDAEGIVGLSEPGPMLDRYYGMLDM